MRYKTKLKKGILIGIFTFIYSAANAIHGTHVYLTPSINSHTINTDGTQTIEVMATRIWSSPRSFTGPNRSNIEQQVIDAVDESDTATTDYFINPSHFGSSIWSDSWPGVTNLTPTLEVLEANNIEDEITINYDVNAVRLSDDPIRLSFEFAHDVPLMGMIQDRINTAATELSNMNTRASQLRDIIQYNSRRLRCMQLQLQDKLYNGFYGTERRLREHFNNQEITLAPGHIDNAFLANGYRVENNTPAYDHDFYLTTIYYRSNIRSCP